MDKAIEYVLLTIEQIYYEQNIDIRIAKESCMKDEGLICNCITGIAINYVGYLLCICLEMKECKIYFEMSSTIGYVKVEYKGKPLISVRLNELENSKCFLCGKICSNITGEQQTRIAFRSHPDIKTLNDKVEAAEDVMEEVNSKKGIEYCYRLKFWILFISALRTNSLDESSKPFLAMAIFMFPSKTINHIDDAVNNTMGNKCTELYEIKCFLEEYLKFLDRVGRLGDKLSFYVFCREFKRLTNLEISYIIEDFIYNHKVPDARETLGEIFRKSLKYNLQQMGKRGKLTKIIQKLKSSLDAIA